jgi:hypothetical protein
MVGTCEGDSLMSPLRRASMRPRAFTRGNVPAKVAGLLVREASMRPREYTRGNERDGRYFNETIEASMRPREYTRGNPTRKTSPSTPSGCFNEAPRIHAGKQAS